MRRFIMIAILMGSDSDFPVVQKAIQVIRSVDVEVEVKILSAHRTPSLVQAYMEDAVARGVKVFIGAAGKAAHLPGVMASHTTLPIIGLPIKTSDLGGMDSLLSIVQMPEQIPVATVGINAAMNAGLLALQMLSIEDTVLQEKLVAMRVEMQKVIVAKNDTIAELEAKYLDV